MFIARDILFLAFFIPGAFILCLVVCFQAFSAMEQLRTHCATEISELERIVGSQQELSAALDQTYPQQVQKTGKSKRLYFNLFSITSIGMCLLSPCFSTNAGCIKPGLYWNAKFCFWCFVHNHGRTIQFDERSMYNISF